MKKGASKFIHLKSLVAAILVSCLVASCTKQIDVEIPKQDAQLVVEGNIDVGQPPLIFLTRSQNFFGNINVNDLSSYYVHNARIWVRHENDSVQLAEFCLNNLPLTQRQKEDLLRSFGFRISDSLPLPNVCLYSVPDLFSCILNGGCSFTGKFNSKYHLRIEADGKVLTATTTIPRAIGIKSLEVRPRPRPVENDSFVSVFVNLEVPDTFGNFVRYWTKRNSEPFYLPASQSVWSDKLFVGLDIALPLERGYPPRANVKPEDYSYFLKGDTVTLRWANIDSRTYDFYNTLENDGGQSPFSNPVRVLSNIEGGGLGVWAGYGSQYYTIIIPR
ncbi:MAG: DUF4249 family protein [Chitinophagales bacterium]|nr:DUF4249 domain-containing protein [Chitinophagales bacterium]MDW8274262.1 DUF4249 family protein [Chitinophagales bacterium]